MKDHDKIFFESNTVRANFNAIEKMRNQIPNESSILKGFDKLQSDYNLFEGKINQVCHQLNSIDKKFNRENYRNKETDPTYEEKYDSSYQRLKKSLKRKKKRKKNLHLEKEREKRI